MNQKNKIKLHNFLWWLLIITFSLSIILGLLGFKSAIYIYGGCFIISLIMGKLKKKEKDE